MKERQCLRCGRSLPPGSLAYVAQINVFADFDGIVLEPEGEIEEQVKRVLDQIQDVDPKELEKEVYEEITLLLCKGCRDRLVEETHHPWEGPFWIRSGGDRMVH